MKNRTKIEEIYWEQVKEIETNLNQLQVKLMKHQKNFQKDPTNWGYVGDLLRLNTETRELLSFLKV